MFFRVLFMLSPVSNFFEWMLLSFEIYTLSSSKRETERIEKKAFSIPKAVMSNWNELQVEFFLLALKTYRCHLSKQANGKSSTKFACTLTQGLRMIWPKSTGRDSETNLSAQTAKLANVLLNGATEDDIWNAISNNQQNAVITYKRNYRHDFQRMNTF